jgi:hypothetical protein
VSGRLAERSADALEFDTLCVLDRKFLVGLVSDNGIVISKANRISGHLAQDGSQGALKSVVVTRIGLRDLRFALSKETDFVRV